MIDNQNSISKGCFVDSEHYHLVHFLYSVSASHQLLIDFQLSLSRPPYLINGHIEFDCTIANATILE